MLAIAPATVALKVAVVAPAGEIVTDAGTVNSALLLASVIVVPPAGAACVTVTVHVDVPPLPSAPGLQTTDDTAGTITTPPFADKDTADPVASTATGLITPMEVVGA